MYPTVVRNSLRQMNRLWNPTDLVRIFGPQLRKHHLGDHERAIRNLNEFVLIMFWVIHTHVDEWHACCLHCITQRNHMFHMLIQKHGIFQAESLRPTLNFVGDLPPLPASDSWNCAEFLAEVFRAEVINTVMDLSHGFCPAAKS